MVRSKIAAGGVGVLAAVLMIGMPVGASSQAKASKDRKSPARIATEHLGVDRDSVRVTDLYTSGHNQVTHVYLRQLIKGEDVVGGVATVNIQDGAVIFSGSRFVDPKDASGEQLLDATDALEVAMRSVGAEGVVTEAPALVYRALPDRTARLAFELEIETPKHWWNIAIDAENGRILERFDMIDSENVGEVAARTVRTEDADIAQALLPKKPILPPHRADDGSSYNIYALPLESPNDGDRMVVRNPADKLASPYGWHDTNGVVGPEFTITRGNNVNAYADTIDDNAPDPASQPDGGRGLDFDHEIPTFDAGPLVFRDAAVDNLFYWSNVMHDVTFRYGFNEAAGNFQASNYSGQGRGGDEVQAQAQDGSGALNANFSTPEEGESGRMQMYLWVDAFDTLGLTQEAIVRAYDGQIRDGDFDGGVIAHEYGHGVSNRLVGGPNNVDCLRMHDEREGEGWSDFWSYALTMRAGDDGATPRGIGTYVVYHEGGRKDKGIRITPYSTNMKVNPATYDTIRSAAEPHGVGYVWASMLWDLYWNLVDKHGFNPNPYESWKSGGNNLAMQLVVDGMKFAPCEPGFEDARDAIIAADAALTGDPSNDVPGDNECLIWRTFARRGLGINAKQRDVQSKVDGVQGFKVPDHCRPVDVPKSVRRPPPA